MELQHTEETHDSNPQLNIRYLTFWTDRRLFAIPITQVVQIIGMQQITELPELPEYVKGIISLRGQIIPVIDVRKRFGSPDEPYNDRTCIIITHVKNSDFGLIVDEVDEVTDILPEQITPPPRLNMEHMNDYLTGIAQIKTNHGQDDRVALLIHGAKILGEDEYVTLAQAATSR